MATVVLGNEFCPYINKTCNATPAGTNTTGACWSYKWVNTTIKGYCQLRENTSAMYNSGNTIWSNLYTLTKMKTGS